jgi:TetR/AcrR family fatty acid metabolism transcriptional regulator
MDTLMTKRQMQALKTKNKIFDTTIELINEKGFANVNIEEICQKAEVSIGTFYYYYKSKNEVFFELYQKADYFFKHTVKESLKTQNCGERILEYFDYYALYCEETGIHTMKQMMNAENKNFIQKGRYIQKLFIEIIHEGQHKNEIIKSVPAEEICDYFFIIARGILFDWCLHDGGYDIRKKVDNYLKPIVGMFQNKNPLKGD